MKTITIGNNNIPLAMLECAENDTRLTGVVMSRIGQQVSIDVDGLLVGFLTPRQDKGIWRTGAIYISPEYRKNGYGAAAILKFFEDKDKGIALIETDNYPSQRAFFNAKFTKHGNYAVDNVVYEIWKK